MSLEYPSSKKRFFMGSDRLPRAETAADSGKPEAPDNPNGIVSVLQDALKLSRITAERLEDRFLGHAANTIGHSEDTEEVRQLLLSDSKKLDEIIESFARLSYVLDAPRELRP